MLVQWSVGVTVLVDSVAWFLVSLAAGYGCHRLGDRRLEHDTALTRLRRFERDGRVYERRLRITRWKDRLPEGGTLFAVVDRLKIPVLYIGVGEQVGDLLDFDPLEFTGGLIPDSED